MKKILSLFLFFYAVVAFSQEITGTWNGVLEVQGVSLRLVFHIQNDEGKFSATMDSPDQNANGIPVSNIKIVDNQVSISVQAIGLTYEGIWNGDASIDGTFKQGGFSVKMPLSKGNTEQRKRPQTPQKPYPYSEEEISIHNPKAENVVLSATLTKPIAYDAYPVAILISGSGAQDRDETIFEHKPFLVLADFLTRNGIAVLRFDDRGVAQSTGDIDTATTFDFATDVEAIFNYLQSRNDLNINKIGLIGHSEGAMIANIVAANNPKVAFIVMLGGTGIRGAELLLMQQEAIARSENMDEDTIREYISLNRKSYDEVIDGTELANAWLTTFIRYNPQDDLAKVKCPVLALGGEKDLQVAAEVNLNAIKTALNANGNKNVTTVILPNTNHLFQECNTCSISEYGSIEQTFSPKAMTEILNWLKKIVF
ncbi:lipoprotein [Bacteroidia bacterium]|nr:lipoprotein [Bacteroidia bacterium]